MSLSTVTLNLGTGGPDVAVDRISAKDYQLVKLTLGAIDANDGPVSSTNPLPTKPGAPDKDTGFDVVSSTGSLVAVPVIGAAAVFYLEGVHFSNPSGAAISVGLTDGANRYIVPIQQIPGHSHLTIAFFGKPTTGLKWNASTAGLYGQAWGRS